MMTVIDKRGIPLTHTFGELKMGECFQDCKDRLCMKVGEKDILVYSGSKWRAGCYLQEDELIIPLKTTITIERE